MESLIKPVNVLSCKCKFCGSDSTRFAVADNGGKVSVCDDCGRKADEGEMNIVWVKREVKRKSRALKFETNIGGHYEAVRNAD